MSEHRGARVKLTCSVLGLAIGASVTACADFYRGPGLAGLRSTSCSMGYISQNKTRNVSVFSGGLPKVNGYEVTFTNRSSTRSATIRSVSVEFFDSSSEKIRSDTVSLLTMHVAPGHSLTQIFYGPNSGYVMVDNPYPGAWASDRSMPSEARLCQVVKW